MTFSRGWIIVAIIVLQLKKGGDRGAYRAKGLGPWNLCIIGYSVSLV